MTALGRINLGVSLLFVLVTLAGLAPLLRQASLRPELTDNLRHIRVSWLRPGEWVDGQAGSGLQRWLARQLLDPALLVADVWPLGDGRELRIALDPYDEIEEIQIRCCNCCSVPSPGSEPADHSLRRASRPARAG